MSGMTSVGLSKRVCRGLGRKVADWLNECGAVSRQQLGNDCVKRVCGGSKTNGTNDETSDYEHITTETCKPTVGTTRILDVMVLLDRRDKVFLE